jgi:hypothetical protein
VQKPAPCGSVPIVAPKPGGYGRAIEQKISANIGVLVKFAIYSVARFNFPKLIQQAYRLLRSPQTG